MEEYVNASTLLERNLDRGGADDLAVITRPANTITFRDDGPSVGAVVVGVLLLLAAALLALPEARDLLLEQGVAWCVAETDERDPGPDDAPAGKHSSPHPDQSSSPMSWSTTFASAAPSSSPMPTRRSVRFSGAMVVSLSWAGIISPKPLKRETSTLPRPENSLHISSSLWASSRA